MSTFKAPTPRNQNFKNLESHSCRLLKIGRKTGQKRPETLLKTDKSRCICNLQIPGLMPRQFDRVKLHMTVLNTIFRKDDSDFQEEKAEQQQRETLDARSLLKVA